MFERDSQCLVTWDFVWRASTKVKLDGDRKNNDLY